MTLAIGLLEMSFVRVRKYLYITISLILFNTVFESLYLYELSEVFNEVDYSTIFPY